MIAELQTLKKNTNYYSDIPAGFQKSVVNNDLSASYDLRAVQESLVGIITTRKGERPFMPYFGCDVQNQLFENMSPMVSYAIQNSIKDAVKAYEPRVILKNVRVYPQYDTNTYDVSIEYHLITDYDTVFETNMKLRSNANG